MKIKVKGEMTIAEIRQALFEMLCKVEGFGVRHSLDATLYIRPTNGFGDDVSPRHPTGEAVTNLYSTGPYRAAADEYGPPRHRQRDWRR